MAETVSTEPARDEANPSTDSGFVLYYSEEGYPYYYNAITGESMWAEYDATTPEEGEAVLDAADGTSYDTSLYGAEYNTHPEANEGAVYDSGTYEEHGIYDYAETAADRSNFYRGGGVYDTEDYQGGYEVRVKDEIDEEEDEDLSSSEEIDEAEEDEGEDTSGTSSDASDDIEGGLLYSSAEESSADENYSTRYGSRAESAQRRPRPDETKARHSSSERYGLGNKIGMESQKKDKKKRTMEDRFLEVKFKAFLRTPEGQVAMEAELARLMKKVEKNQSKQGREREREYVKRLLRNGGIATAVMNSGAYKKFDAEGSDAESDLHRGHGGRSAGSSSSRRNRSTRTSEYVDPSYGAKGLLGLLKALPSTIISAATGGTSASASRDPSATRTGAIPRPRDASAAPGSGGRGNNNNISSVGGGSGTGSALLDVERGKDKDPEEEEEGSSEVGTSTAIRSAALQGSTTIAQRHNSSAAAASSIAEARGKGGRGSGSIGTSSPRSHRSSSSSLSSGYESLSSDDSDVREINAPLFSEFAEWTTSWEAVRSTYIQPVQEFMLSSISLAGASATGALHEEEEVHVDTEGGCDGGGGSGIELNRGLREERSLIATSQAAILNAILSAYSICYATNEGERITLSTVLNSMLALAQQGASIVGNQLVVLSAAAYESANRHVLTSLMDMVDGTGESAAVRPVVADSDADTYADDRSLRQFSQNQSHTQSQQQPRQLQQMLHDNPHSISSSQARKANSTKVVRSFATENRGVEDSFLAVHAAPSAGRPPLGGPGRSCSVSGGSIPKALRSTPIPNIPTTNPYPATASAVAAAMINGGGKKTDPMIVDSGKCTNRPIEDAVGSYFASMQPSVFQPQQSTVHVSQREPIHPPYAPTPVVVAEKQGAIEVENALGKTLQGVEGRAEVVVSHCAPEETEAAGAAGSATTITTTAKAAATQQQSTEHLHSNCVQDARDLELRDSSLSLETSISIHNQKSVQLAETATAIVEV